VKVREIIKLIEKDGWYLRRTRGSHRQYKHSKKPGLVTIAGKANDDLAAGTLNSILKRYCQKFYEKREGLSEKWFAIVRRSAFIRHGHYR